MTTNEREKIEGMAGEMREDVWEEKMENEKRIRTAVHLREVRELTKGMRVAEGNEDDAVVRESTDRVLDGDLLSSAGARRAHKRASVLACQAALPPQAARRIPERLRHTLLSA